MDTETIDAMLSDEDVREDNSKIIVSGAELMKKIEDIAGSGVFEEFEFALTDGEVTVGLTCLGFVKADRYGSEKLYLAYKYHEDDENGLYTSYVAKKDGIYYLVAEDDDAMVKKVSEMFEALAAEDSAQASEKPKKKKKWWQILLIVLFIPIWLIWQFIKALLSLFNIAVGDSSAVRSFKEGFSGGGSSKKKYTVTNDMGCTETVFSDNERDFYYADGSYAGSSDDGGRTLHK